MCSSSKFVFVFRNSRRSRTVVLTSLSWLILLFPAIPLQAENSDAASGVAWDVRGTWRVAGSTARIVAGDSVQPGALLWPDEEGGAHSITVLMPDGDRVLYECFTATDCARGFRVPLLFQAPEPFASEMLARIRMLVRDNRDFPQSPVNGKPLPRDEVVATLTVDNHAEIGGLAARLPNGRYTCEVRPLDPAQTPRIDVVIEKNAPSIVMALPSAGLYEITVSDELNRPRIDLLVAAVKPEQEAIISKSFGDATAILRKWNRDFYNWPMHDFRRAYLESLMLGMNPPSHEEQAGAAAKKATADWVKGAREPGVTAEPAFSPDPGSLNGNAAITLRCGTPGCSMHYTIDGSQPVESSPAYAAPIEIKATGLTVKAFASSTGKKDSAVVTASYRIRN